jgi:hypothetical protein
VPMVPVPDILGRGPQPYVPASQGTNREGLCDGCDEARRECRCNTRLSERSIRSSRGRDSEFPRSGDEAVLDEAKR